MDRQRNPAVKWGLIFGGLLILLALINLGIEFATGAQAAAASPSPLASMNFGASLLQGCLVFLIELALFFVAGLLTARENGRVGSAAIAGVIAGALAAIVGAIITAVTLLSRPLATVVPPGVSMTPDEYHSLLLVIVILGVILGVAFDIGIGAGMAALGGLVGKSQFERTHLGQPMAETYYTPMAPAPGYPVHPQGGYPQGSYPPAPGAYPPAGAPEGYPPQQYPPQQYPPQYPPAPPQNPENPQQ
jgi:hypothetical protein